MDKRQAEDMRGKGHRVLLHFIMRNEIPYIILSDEMKVILLVAFLKSNFLKEDFVHLYFV